MTQETSYSLDLRDFSSLVDYALDLVENIDRVDSGCTILAGRLLPRLGSSRAPAHCGHWKLGH